MARQELERYDLKRYFGDDVPKDVLGVLTVDGVRPLKSGSKFKVSGERGEFTFLYTKGDSVTCFDPLGRFLTLPKSKVKRAVNRTHRQIHKGE